MAVSTDQKEIIKGRIRDAFSREREIQKIVLFGSFVHSSRPNDIDIAIFQNSDEKYLSLALKYRKLAREVSKIIPVDIIPLKIPSTGAFVDEIESGEVIYER